MRHRHRHDDAFEGRLDQLRDEALERGLVDGEGVHAAHGPLPLGATTSGRPGYYGLPLLKPPVWKWMVPLYFFVGGLAGMAALIAAVAYQREHDWDFVGVALRLAAAGAVLSPVLLVWDLGRPSRFVNMLRVFKPQSPMSVGSWLVAGFGATAIPALLLAESQRRLLQTGATSPAIHALAVAALFSAGAIGLLLAVYTGALLAVSALPVWQAHRVVLPFHFGMAALGSAASAIELCDRHSRALNAIALGAAAAETAVVLWIELRRRGAVDRALREGRSGWTIRAGGLLAGPLALTLRITGKPELAAASFLLGALASRFGWVAAGRVSALDPESLFESQGVGAEPPEPAVDAANGAKAAPASAH
jgi:formate-dependent nitrite reductase membrane component NrfD